MEQRFPSPSKKDVANLLITSSGDTALYSPFLPVYPPPPNSWVSKQCLVATGSPSADNTNSVFTVPHAYDLLSVTLFSFNSGTYYLPTYSHSAFSPLLFGLPNCQFPSSFKRKVLSASSVSEFFLIFPFHKNLDF
jgi:hypothetical protein